MFPEPVASAASYSSLVALQKDMLAFASAYHALALRLRARLPQLPRKRRVSLSIDQLRAMLVQQQFFDRETGGFLSFHERRNKLDHMQIFIGESESVDFANRHHLEVNWHTHPFYGDGRKVSPPSPQDFLASLVTFDLTGSQISLVVAYEGLYVLWPELVLLDRYFTEQLTPAETRRFADTLRRLFFDSRSFERGDLTAYLAQVRAWGFRIHLLSWQDIQAAGALPLVFLAKA